MKSHRIVTVVGSVLFGALLLGAPEAAAAPPPTRATEVEAPPTYYPRPRGEVPAPATEVTDEPCETECPAPEPPDEEPPAEDPADDSTEDPADAPAEEPAEESAPEPAGTVGQPEAPTGVPAVDRPVGQPRPAPAGVPVPARIDTGEGPGEGVNWWLIGISAAVLLGLAFGGAQRWIARTERSPR